MASIRLRLPAAALAFLACASALAQQGRPAALPDAPAPRQETQPQASHANPLGSGVDMFLTLQRKSLVFPDLATNGGRLSSWQKLKLAANNSVSVSTLGAAAIGASFSFGIGTTGYGQEAGGWGKRYGADLARAASANLFGTYMIASVLHEDPRFYVRANLNFPDSVKYAAARSLFVRSDSEQQVVNYSGLLGPLAAESLADTYYPKANRGLGSVLLRYASDQGWKFAGHLLRQYWPEINGRLKLARDETMPADNPAKP